MYPIIFQLGPLTIYSFGAFMALAALTAVWLLSAELKRRGYNRELASTLVFAAAVGGLIGARLLFIVEEWQAPPRRANGLHSHRRGIYLGTADSLAARWR